MSEIASRIFNVQKFSTEDGPGIRTTVFMKGCPLRCKWCHNPEGMRPQPELMWYDGRCIAARDCQEVCPEKALELNLAGMRINRGRCTVCGLCAEACPSAALEVIGVEWSLDRLFDELIKDQIFYQASGGGITFSGGEPVMQVDFLEAFLPRCKQAGMHVALDTCGALPWWHYQRLLEWLDLVLFDLKIMDAKWHQQATGRDNQLILSNARRLAEERVPMWIRTPIIPGYTRDAENIRAIGEFIRNELHYVERWDLLAYTNLGKPKYTRLDQAYLLENDPLLTVDDMEETCQLAKTLVPYARWSGATRVDG